MSEPKIPDRAEWPDWVQHAIKRAVDDRVSAKNDKIELLEGELAKAREQAESASGSTAELERVRSEFDEYRTRIEESAAFRAAGIDPDDEGNAALLERIRVLHRHDTAGAEEPKGIAAWLSEDAPSDPLLSPYLPAAQPAPDADGSATEPAAEPASTAPVPAPAMPPRGGGGRPPMPTKRTVDDVRNERAEIMARARRLPHNSPERGELLTKAREKLREAEQMVGR